MSKETEVLPCPFCGGDAEEKHRHNFNAVTCATCHATVPQSGINYKNAGKLWNRRAADRELRRVDAGMPVVAWLKYDGQDFEYNTVDEFSGGRTGGSALVKLADAQAALAEAQAMAEYAAMTEKGAKAWADVPNATAWVDELRGNAPAQPVVSGVTDADVSAACIAGSFPTARVHMKYMRHALESFAASRVLPGVLAATRDVDTADRKPLTDDALDDLCEKHLFSRRSLQDFARVIEAAHGITAQQGEKT